MWAPSNLTMATMRGDSSCHVPITCVPALLAACIAITNAFCGWQVHPREALLSSAAARQTCSCCTYAKLTCLALRECRQGSLTISVRIAGDKGKGGVKDLKQLSGGYSIPVADPRLLPPDCIRMQQ